MTDNQASAARPGLSRVLGLWSLIIYGIVLIQPTAPMSPFGVVSVKAEGHVVTTILIGMVAMLFTAISYGRMAAVYPSAGSAYAYVGHTIHPALGYVTGWSMLFDYVMNPIICVIWCSKAAAELPAAAVSGVGRVLRAALHRAQPAGRQDQRPHERRDRDRAWCVVIVLFLVAAFRYLAGMTLDAAALTRPFYDPGHLLLGQGLDRHQPRRADLHRLRRHLDACRRRRRTRAATSCSRPCSSASSPGSSAACWSTWRS